jgi:hypothetical protein
VTALHRRALATMRRELESPGSPGPGREPREPR